MEHFQWDFPAPVGMLEIDEQHRELHGLLLKLFGTLATDPNGALPEFRFIRLLEQTAVHFRTEEECFHSLGYPGLDSHRRDHEGVMARIRADLARWDAPDAPPLFDLVEDFAESFQHHLETADQAFADWLETTRPRGAADLASTPPVS